MIGQNIVAHLKSIKLNKEHRKDLAKFAGHQFKALIKKNLNIPVKLYHL